MNIRNTGHRIFLLPLCMLQSVCILVTYKLVLHWWV